MSQYEQWLEAKATLDAAKKEELRLRNLICNRVLKDKLEGAVTKQTPDFKVTATAKLNRKLDVEVLEAIWEDLTEEEQEAVVYKPSLKLTEYKKIEQTGGKLLEAVTVAPAQATLKIVEV